MRALVIAPQPFFSPRGTPFSVYYRTLVTSELGFEIDLLTYGEGEDVDIPNVRIYRVPRFDWLGRVKTGPSMTKLFLDVFMLLWSLGLLIGRRYTFVHAHEESVFFCRFLKPIFGFKLIYDMHSSLPEQLSNFDFTQSKLIIGIFKWLEDSSLQAADGIITICPALADYVKGLVGETDRHVLIENSIFEPVKLAPSVKEEASVATEGVPMQAVTLPSGRRFVVYAGTLEAYQGIDLLVGAFAEVGKEIPDAFLIIVGGNPDQVREYSGLADRLGVSEHSLFTGRVSQAEARYYSSLASVLVSPRSAGSNTPLKIYELLASGIPLVATRIYSHTQVLDDEVAFLVAPEAGAIVQGIREALENTQERDRKIRRAKLLYEEKYSRPVYTAKLRQLLEQVGSRNGVLSDH